ncbi:MAG: hypothetical protein KAJ33_08735, partial [Thermoplasmata archaeon]|nr:hypothetical protein [Thermoplasmata archaeon]
MNIDVEVFNLEIYENEYGIGIYGNETSYANVHDNYIWRCTGIADSGASSIYVYASENGTVDATAIHNEIIENTCGSIRFGYQNAGIQSGTTIGEISNNTLIGNDGGGMVNAEGNVSVKIVDNYMAGSDYFNKVDRFKLGIDKGNSVACQNLTFEFSRNIVWCGKAGDGWDTGVVLITGAQEEMVATVTDNDIRGGDSMGGVIWLGEQDETNYIPKNQTTYFARNYVEMLYDHDADTYVTGTIAFSFASKYNTNLTFVDNTWYATNSFFGGLQYGQGVLFMGNDGDTDYTTYNLTAAIERNTFITHQQYYDYFHGPFISVNSLMDMDMKINDNYFEFTEYYGAEEPMSGFVQIGNRYDNEYGPEEMRIDMNNNEMRFYATDDEGLAPSGFVDIRCNDSCENTFINFTANDILFSNTGDSWSYMQGILQVANADNDYYSENVTAVVNDNTFLGEFGEGAYSQGITICAEENLNVTMNNNHIETHMTDESSAYSLDVRLGYYCSSNGIITENTTVLMKDNYIRSNGQSSAISAAANHDLDFTLEGGEILEAYYASCSGVGPFTT